MRTKLFSAAVLAVTMVGASAAEAQVAIGPPYHSGIGAGYMAVALQHSGGPRVIFDDSNADVIQEWDPLAGTMTAIASPYNKDADATAYWAVAYTGNGIEAWDFAGTWTLLMTPGAQYSHHVAAAWKEKVVWPEKLAGNAESGLTLRQLPSTASQHFLWSNGREEMQPALYDDLVAYEFADVTGTRVAVHDLSSDTPVYDSPGYGERMPDIYGTLLAYESSVYGIVWEDIGSGASGTVSVPAGCSSIGRPLFGGYGDWIIYYAWCGTHLELRLYDRTTGIDQFIDFGGYELGYHVVDGWLAYQDDSTGVVFRQLGNLAAPPQGPLPSQRWIHSGRKGVYPTLGYDYSNAVDPHVALFYDLNYDETWRWEPIAGVDYGTGDKKKFCDGGADMFACSEEVAIYHASNSWSHVAPGRYATTDEIGISIAWEEHNVGPDLSIAWYNTWTGTITWYGDHNGRHERHPVTMGYKVAYFVDNGGSAGNDVEVLDILNGTTWVAPDLGEETFPDLLYHNLAYESSGHPGGLAWWDAQTGNNPPVPTPGTCASYHRPRLGYHGLWVVYEGAGCASGASELYLADMRCGGVYHVDTVLPHGDLPNYAMWDDKLVYADGNAEIVYVDVDEAALCGSPGPRVPSITTVRSGQAAQDVAYFYDGEQTVLFSDATETWDWEAEIGVMTGLGAPNYGQLDGLEKYAVGMYRNRILAYDGSWSVIGKGNRPTAFGDNFAWEDGGGSIEVLWGYSTSYTVLAGNGYDELNPSLYKEHLAYEVDVGGNWDVGIHNAPGDFHIDWAPDLGDERNPDIWDGWVAYDIGERELARYGVGGFAFDVIPPPTGCRQVRRPLLGDGGSFILFEAAECPGAGRGGRELWIYSFNSGRYWFVDFLGGSRDYSYHLVERFVGYVDGNDEAVYLEVDVGAL